MAITDQTTDFGTDIALVSDLAPVWGFATGQTNLLNAILRRLTIPRGGLFYDPDYGFDVPGLLNVALSPIDVARIKGGIAAEVRKDPRVESVAVDAVFTFATKTLQLTLSITTALGPFDLVLAATSVTVEVLSLNGVAPVITTTDNPTVIVGPIGPQGLQGIAGTSGGGGGGTADLVLDQSDTRASSAGTEEVIFQWDAADFGALAAGTLTGEVTASAYSGSGTATFKLRVGGSDGVNDGTVVATFTATLAAFTAKNATGTFTNPTGLAFVKLTAQSSGAGVDARAKGPTITFR